MSMNDLALQDATARRLVEALPLLEQTLELRKVTLGPEHRSTLKSMNTLARAYKCAGRLVEALLLFERTLELRKATLGPEHWDTLASMNRLAIEYESAGRLAEALPLYEQELLLTQAALGTEHPNSLISMNNLALAFAKAGRLAEAVPLFEQTLEFMNEKFGSDYHNTLGAMVYLVTAYLAGEQPEKALPLLDRYIAGHRGRSTPDDLLFAGMLIAVSAKLLQHRQYETAEPYLRECLMIREKQLPDDWKLFNSKSTLGGALAGQKKFQEAEPLLVEGYSGMKAREAKIAPPRPAPPARSDSTARRSLCRLGETGTGRRMAEATRSGPGHAERHRGQATEGVEEVTAAFEGSANPSANAPCNSPTNGNNATPG